MSDIRPGDSIQLRVYWFEKGQQHDVKLWFTVEEMSGTHPVVKMQEKLMVVASENILGWKPAPRWNMQIDGEVAYRNAP